MSLDLGPFVPKMESPSGEDNALAIVEVPPCKQRKRKSIVWEYFTTKPVSPDSVRACCNQCGQSFSYKTGSKVAGTSHLKRHIAKGTCLATLRNQETNQLTPCTPKNGIGCASSDPKPRKRYRSSASLAVATFDPVLCHRDIANMIILHDYPLHMVEHPGFVAFVQNIQPRFGLMSFNTVEADCVAAYLSERHSLIKVIEALPGRICLTMDTWHSSQTVGYVFLTGHYIDKDWKRHKRLLSVVMEPFIDLDVALSDAVAGCLSDWSLNNKIFSITVNHPFKDSGTETLRALLAVKNPYILNGQLLLTSCISRTFSSIAKDILEAGKETVKKVRESVKYVKTIECHEERFLKLKQQLQVPSDKTIVLDNQTQWNTTYEMLTSASELKEVFSCLDTSDPDYKQAPSMEDWVKVEKLCSYLKLFYDTANNLKMATNPTSNIFFHEVWKILLELACPPTSQDPIIVNLSKTIQDKFDKYWKDCNLVLGMAVVMDPRFKMKLVEFSFSKVYGEEAAPLIKIIDDGIHELFHEYIALPLAQTFTEQGNVTGVNIEDSGSLVTSNGLTAFDVYIMESTGQNEKTELEQYLEESLLPRWPDLDVLGWWKVNKLKYPILSKMARDVLAIPVCTVSNDSVFDMMNKEMDSYRSSLRPGTVEALICAKDWLQQGSIEG